ncbi:MAG: glycosyltransferase family 4 protein [Pseudomonadota bacterium]
MASKTIGKTAWVIAAPDGIISSRCGIGVVVHSFFEAFDELLLQARSLSGNVAIHAIGIALDRSSADRDDEIERRVRLVCGQRGGALHLVSNTKPARYATDVFSSTVYEREIDEWRHCSRRVANHVDEISGQYERTHVILHDTMLLATLAFCKRLSGRSFLWIAHSLGAFFSGSLSAQALEIEREVLSAVAARDDIFFGYIGEQVRQSLIEDYNLPTERLVAITNGIFHKSARFTPVPIDQYIPAHAKVIFAFGRADHQKGFDLLLAAFANVHSRLPDHHLILLAPQGQDESYAEFLKSQLSDVPASRFTIIDRFIENFPQAMLVHDQLDMVVLPSRFEANSIAGLEASAFTRSSVAVIYSDIQCFVDAFRGRPNAICLEELTVTALEKALEKARQERREVDGGAANENSFVRNTAAAIDAFAVHEVD